jgi:hypothetical protein
VIAHLITKALEFNLIVNDLDVFMLNFTPFREPSKALPTIV